MLTKEQIARECAQKIHRLSIYSTNNLEQAIRAALEAYDRSQWIPTSERLPEPRPHFSYTEVLGLVVATSEMREMEFHPNRPPGDRTPWASEEGWHPLGFITHWRPLPTLPDTGENEG